MNADRTTALLFAAHGSRHSADAGDTARRLALAAQADGRWDEVRVAFWTEQPEFREAALGIASERVVVVPVFTADGWFTRRVLPGELGLPSDADQAWIGGREWVLAPVLGTLPAFAEAVRARFDDALAHSDLDASDPLPADAPETALLVVGHGTRRSSTSGASVRAHAARLEGAVDAAVVQVAFLDQEPALATFASRLPECVGRVIVVPAFVGDGPHTRCDLPEAMGIPEHRTELTSARLSVPTAAPTTPGAGPRRPVRELRVHYTSAAGSHPLIAALANAAIEAALRRAEHASVPGDHDEVPDAWHAAATPQHVAAARRALCARLDPRPNDAGTNDDAAMHVLGEVAVRPDADGWVLCHRTEVAAAPDATRAVAAAELSALAAHRDDGSYRGIRSAADLATGWRHHAPTPTALWDALEWLAPGALALDPTLADRLPVSSWTATGAQLPGRQSTLVDVDSETVEALVATHCTRCTRTPAWHVEPAAEQTGDASTDAVRCPRPCAWLRAEALAG